MESDLFVFTLIISGLCDTSVGSIGLCWRAHRPGGREDRDRCGRLVGEDVERACGKQVRELVGVIHTECFGCGA